MPKIDYTVRIQATISIPLEESLQGDIDATRKIEEILRDRIIIRDECGAPYGGHLDDLEIEYALV